MLETLLFDVNLVKLYLTASKCVSEGIKHTLLTMQFLGAGFLFLFEVHCKQVTDSLPVKLILCPIKGKQNGN